MSYVAYTSVTDPDRRRQTPGTVTSLPPTLRVGEPAINLQNDETYRLSLADLRVTTIITVFPKHFCPLSTIFTSFVSVWQVPQAWTLATVVQVFKGSIASDRSNYRPISLNSIFSSVHPLVICPIAIAYSIGQIIRPVCLCPCVRLRALSRSHFLMNFHQNWHRRKQKSKVVTGSLGVNIAPPLPHFAQKSISGEEVLKMHANINKKTL